MHRSKIYMDYERAFTAATGLPLALQLPGVDSVPARHSFCALLAKTNVSCAACYALQKKLEEEASLAPKTLKCFAGMCETAVPVRVGENVIAFLRTGQVLLRRPDRAGFSRIAKKLPEWGTQLDLKKLEEAYYHSRVLSKQQYEGLVRLLTLFAEHLAAFSNQLALHAEGAEGSPDVTRARQFIEEHAGEDLQLAEVARAVNVSASYFSAKFKKATGINFVEYVARVRVEKARNLLQNPHLRISEIAFEVGFQSLSQFNRSFRRIAGKSPKAYRSEFERSVR